MIATAMLLTKEWVKSQSNDLYASICSIRQIALVAVKSE
jgi:hypothetical protein